MYYRYGGFRARPRLASPSGSRDNYAAALENSKEGVERIKEAVNHLAESETSGAGPTDFMFTAKELRLQRKRAGKWAKHDIRRGMAQWEGLGLLLWAGQLVESMPSVDVGFSQPSLVASSPFTANNVQSISRFLTVAPEMQMRDAGAVEHELKRAQIWHWRSHMFTLAPRDDDPGTGADQHTQYWEAVAKGVGEGLGSGALSDDEVITRESGGTDLKLTAGGAFAAARPEHIALIAGHAQKRLQIAGWLTGTHWMEVV